LTKSDPTKFRSTRLRAFGYITSIECMSTDLCATYELGIIENKWFDKILYSEFKK